MKAAYKPLIVILICGLGLGAILAAPVLFRSNHELGSSSDYESARAAARAANKPLLLDFTATWCEPCQQMKQNVLSDSAVQNVINSRFVPVQVDIDHSPQLAQQYQISAVPTYKIVSADGAVLKEQTGAMSKDEFVQWLGTSAPAATRP